jgi:anaerobic magnesium-protoporphyrin IX monomethyl ester cyclase
MEWKFGELENSNTKVLLLFPPFEQYEFGDKWVESESLSAPMGLMHIAATLEEYKYDLDFIDLAVEHFEKKDFLARLKKKHFILITCLTRFIQNVSKIIHDIRDVNPNAFIICGGPHCNATKMFFPGSSLTVVGEAENIIGSLLDCIKARKTPDFPGLIYYKNDKLIKTAGNLLVEDLDKSRFPSFSLAEKKSYGKLFGHKTKGLMPMITSRGCPFSCTFCTFTNKYRERSIDNIIAEIKLRVSQGANVFSFFDDVFMLKRERALEFAERIISEKIKIKMVVQARVDSADLVLYRKLKQAGLILLSLGIENANQEVLDFYDKKITIKQIQNATSMANKVGILTCGYLIIGAPMETREHFEKILKFANKIRLDFITLNILEYEYGSRLWQDLFNKGMVKEDDYYIPVNEKFSNFTWAEMEEIQNDLIKRFYLNLPRGLRIFYKSLRLGDSNFLRMYLKAFLSKNIYLPPQRRHESK